MSRRQKLMSFLLIKINFFQNILINIIFYINMCILINLFCIKKIKPIEFSFNFKIKYRKFYYYNQVLCAFIMRKKENKKRNGVYFLSTMNYA